MILKKQKRTKNDAPAPIVKPCFVAVHEIWNKSNTVSSDLTPRILHILCNAKRNTDENK